MTTDALQLEALGRLVAAARPRLHRYCARMVGSVFEGEDVLQEALAKATVAFPSAGILEQPERWLFTIAHNTALDALRRRRRQAEVSLDEDAFHLHGTPPEVDAWAAGSASLAMLMHLPVSQRSMVVLVDVLEYSLSEAADILGMTLPAVKAALHRGRERLSLLAVDEARIPPTLDADELVRLRAYADSFNARDFDALRDLLADDVRLDLVNRRQLAGRKDVSVYFTRYSEANDWRLTAGIAEGRPALLVCHPDDQMGRLNYVVLLEWTDGRISGIRDFHYARYITECLEVTDASEAMQIIM